MRVFFTVVLILACQSVSANEWRKLDGQGVKRALTARTVAYDSGAIQDFFANGRTLYGAGAESWGEWHAQNDQYCSIWPPSDIWVCYDVSLRDDGLVVRFQDSTGSYSDGRYIDLK